MTPTGTLGERTWPAVAASPPLLLVPVGSCEQHGLHLPLDADCRIALAVAGGAAARLPAAVVAPTVAIGASGEHAGFAGTLSIGVEVLTSLVVELVRSADWAAGVVMVNGHGGNAAALAAAARLLMDEDRRILVWSARVPGGDAHAGRTETSLLLALAPEWVILADALPGRIEPIGELLPALQRHGVQAVSPNGVLGDPSDATAEEGRATLAALVDDLVTAVERWRR